MGAIVVLVVAVALALLAAVGVAVWRLLGAVKTLRGGVEENGQRLQPLLDELTSGAQTAGVEVDAVRTSVETLRTGRNGHH